LEYWPRSALFRDSAAGAEAPVIIFLAFDAALKRRSSTVVHAVAVMVGAVVVLANSRFLTGLSDRFGMTKQ
jgi:multisubunit Na+/H+ antiporter MnhB subunit